MSDKYVVYTSVATFRMRYAIPTDAIADGLLDDNPSDMALIEQGKVLLEKEQVKELSQLHVGDTVVDAGIYDEETVLKIHDKDNEYLKDWSLEQKLEFIRNWEDDYFTNKQKEQT